MRAPQVDVFCNPF